MRRSVVILFLIVAALGMPLTAQRFPPPFKAPLTPESLWTQLTNDGNTAYFQRGAIPYQGLQFARRDTEFKQEPPVTVLSCVDSRVPPELIFARGIGDLFVVRLAGNVADDFGIASIEYAVSKGWTKLIVVMGHEDCGAVVEALKTADPPTPSLVALVQRIRESFIDRQRWTGPDLPNAVKANARASAANLLAHSLVIRSAVLSGHVGLIVAYYNLKSGKVDRLQ
jgi:carbonic anhydrase